MSKKEKQIKIIGKVDAVNQGLTYYNTTIFDLDGKAVNIKLRRYRQSNYWPNLWVHSWKRRQRR